MENTVKLIKPHFNTVDIFDFIIGEIEKESGKKVINKEFGNGYFICNFGENTVCQFKMEGAKDWLFSIWVIPEEDGTVNVSLFGEHYWYIDKFKPTATKISQSYTLKQDDTIDELKYNLYDTITAIARIANYPVITYITNYWDTTENPFKMYITDWCFYKIKLPIINFVKNGFNNFLTNIYKVYAELRWSKYINIDIYDSRKDGFSCWPRFDFIIRFKENVDEEIMYDIYHKIHKFKFHDNNVSIDFYEHNAKHPFYY